MRDIFLIALYAFLGAAGAGLLGALALHLLRRRSIAGSLAVVAAVAVAAMLAGTLAVARAMFLSSHDLTVVTLVVAMAAAVSLATALLLGRRVVLGARELVVAAREFGQGGRFTAPVGPAPAELAALSRELAATSARLAASRERERALEASRRELVAWISHDLRTPWPDCVPCPRRWRTGWWRTRSATTAGCVPRWTASTPWSVTSSNSPASTPGP